MYVFLTIDVETYIEDTSLSIWGNGYGLGFLVSTLKEFDIKATFLLKCCLARDGEKNIAKVVKYLLDNDQDVQLHLHPEVADLPFCIYGKSGMNSYDYASQYEMIKYGVELLKEFGVTNVIALRCGDYSANEHTLSAMVANGLVVGSNRNGDGKLAGKQDKFNKLFKNENDLCIYKGVVDVPITHLKSSIPLFDGKKRHMELSAMSLLEIRRGLNDLVHNNYQSCCLLTHPGEMFNVHSDGNMSPNLKNHGRWLGLLKILRENENMQAISFSDFNWNDFRESMYSKRYHLLRLKIA